MAKTHWKKLTNPDYLGAYSLDDGNGGYKDIVATIAYARVETVTGPDGKKDECSVVHFKESFKPMVLNATNSKTLEKLLKTPYIEDWAGCRIQIGVESVKAFGDVVDALRIRKFLPRADGPTKCTVCDTDIVAFEGVSVAQIVAASLKRHGKAICAPCMKALKEAPIPDGGSSLDDASASESEQEALPSALGGDALADAGQEVTYDAADA